MTSKENVPYVADEVKIYHEEGDYKDEIEITENLNEDKMQLVGDSDDEEESSDKPKDESFLSFNNSLFSGPGIFPFSPFWHYGFASQQAQQLSMHDKGRLQISSQMPPMMSYLHFPPPAHQGMNPPDLLKWPAFTGVPMFPGGLPGNPLYYPLMTIPNFSSHMMNPPHKFPHPMMVGHEHSLRSPILNQHNDLTTAGQHFPAPKSKIASKKSKIKKPLNSFMLFLKENKESMKYKSMGSASINKQLSATWNELDESAKEKYKEMARVEKETHALKYPGWSAKDNYALNSKKNTKVKCGGALGLQKLKDEDSNIDSS